MSLLTFSKYQVSVVGKQHNNLILKPEVCKELYGEIDKVMPSLEYCLAPKKTKEASGASNLRSHVSQTVPQSDRDPILLDQHAKVLYEWLDKKERSYIRMIVAFLSEIGLSFNAAAYHRSACCCRYFGNSHILRTHPRSPSRSSKNVSKLGTPWDLVGMSLSLMVLTL